jgi:hypothetical protein
VGRAEEKAPLAEKMIRKLRAAMMPPSFAPQPDPAEIADLARTLEERIDEVAAKSPNPGRRTFQRLNRAEYARSIHGLLALDVDVTAFLPPDTISHGFDNVADVQTMSPTLMEGYLRAAGKISRLAVGDPSGGATEATYKLPRTASQMEHVEGAPFGTRGGISIVHHFPADGQYIFKLMLHGSPTGQLYGAAVKGEQLEISIEGDRVALLDIDPMMDESDPNGMTLASPNRGQGGSAPGLGGVPPEVRGPGGRPDGPIDHSRDDHRDRLRVKTLPHLRSSDQRAAQHHRYLGYGEPPEDLHLPAHVGGGRAALRAADRVPPRDQGLPKPLNETDIEG